MRALWVESGELSFRDDVPTPQPGPGEALLRVRRAGICATDLEVLRGYAGFSGIPGHEVVAEVIEAPHERKLLGRRVAVEINITCGSCSHCQAGRSTHCCERQVLGLRSRDGVFAEMVAVPTANLHVLPDSVDDDRAVFVEPLAAAAAIGDRVDLGPGQKVAVVGAGCLGLLSAQVASASGADVDVVARYPWQQEILAARGIASGPEDGLERAAFDVVIEASGSTSGLDLALDLVRPRGALVLKSTLHGPVQVDLSRVVVGEIDLLGSRCGSFPRAVELLQSGAVDPVGLIEGTMAIADGVEAYAKAAQAGARKVLLEP